MNRLLDALGAHLAATLPPDNVARRIEIAKAAWEKRQIINREDRKSGSQFLLRARDARKELKKASNRFKRKKRFGKL